MIYTTIKNFKFSSFFLRVNSLHLYLHFKSLNITMDTYKSLKIKCAEAGTSITEVCRRAGIHHQVIHAWREREPKSIKTLRTLEGIIEEIKQEKCSLDPTSKAE